MRLLLLNPNRSAWITERVAAPARSLLRAGEVLDTVTSATGPDAVTSADQLAAAALEVQTLAARHGRGYDAIILGISLDCGLHETRAARYPQPVIGMTEAACLAASLAGPKFGLLTIGSGMAASFQAHIRLLGLQDRFVGVAAPDCPEAFNAGSAQFSPGLIQRLDDGVQALVARGAHSVVLAGAVLCGCGPLLRARTGVPVWEGPACALGMARTLLA
ncbi:aspartate/glutamate racemase family protein [Ottowia sp. VDI28]|uniref:aspartate/glutamate racemase family protein n=1 Tax=Ottowia sp. VDI28 TaxID=3133968 RepID=UPI003C2FA281